MGIDAQERPQFVITSEEVGATQIVTISMGTHNVVRFAAHTGHAAVGIRSGYEVLADAFAKLLDSSVIATGNTPLSAKGDATDAYHQYLGEMED